MELYLDIARWRLKRGWRYAYDKTIRGRRLWSPFIYLTRQEAEKAEAEALKTFHETGRTTTRIIGVKYYAVEALIHDWLDWLKLHRSLRYWRDETNRMARALASGSKFARQPASRLATGQVEKWVERIHEDHGPIETNNFLRRLQTIYNKPWGRRRARRELPDNPAQYVERFPVSRKAKYVPTLPEVNAICMAATGKFRLYLEILIETGARPSEALNLAWEDVGLNSVTLYTRKTATGDRVPRMLTITESLVDRLKSWRRQQGPGKKLVFQQARGESGHHLIWTRKRHQDACMRAGVPYFSVGCYRHYAASVWAKGREALTDIQYKLGHSQATTTNRYLHAIKGIS